MRISALALAVIAALMFGGSRAEAWGWGWDRGYGAHPWCGWDANGIEAGSCVYDTVEQCWASIRGAGGYCGLNPMPVAPRAAYQPRRHRRHR